MRKNGPFALAFHTLVILFVLAPLVIVVLVAFTPDETLTLPTRGLSLRWFRAILDYPDFVTAFLNSVKLAFASATLSLAIALPAGLTFDAFAQAIATCYGSDDAAAALSPASLAAAWAVTGWLELVPGPGPGRDPYGLAHTAEDYFFQEVATDHGRAAGVLRCCAAFLGGEAAGPAADLLVRCLEVLAASDSGSGRWLDDVAALPVEEFLVAVEAMRARFAHDHDLMYTVVDHYLEVRTLLNTNLH